MYLESQSVFLLDGGHTRRNCQRAASCTVPSTSPSLFRVTLIEAEPRLGGRVHSYELGGAAGEAPFSVDLGAAWIHGHNHIWHDLALRLQWPVRRSFRAGRTDMVDVGLVPHQEQTDRDQRVPPAVLRKARKLHGLVKTAVQFLRDQAEEAGDFSLSTLDAIQGYMQQYGGSETASTSRAALPDVFADRSIPVGSLDARVYNCLWSGFEDYNACSLSQCCLAGYNDELDVVGGNRDLAGGIGRLPMHLADCLGTFAAERYTQLVGQPVTRIAYEEGEGRRHIVADSQHGTACTVELADGTSVTANYVICTVPLGVLKRAGGCGDVGVGRGGVGGEDTDEAGPSVEHSATSRMNTASGATPSPAALAFEPPLSAAKRDAVARAGVGLLDKVFLRFPSRFWPQDVDRIQLCGPSRDTCAWACVVEASTEAGWTGDCNVLAVLVACELAQRFEDMGEEVAVQVVLAALRQAYGADCVPEPTSYKLTCWSNNPHFCGSYSYGAVGAPPALLDTLAAPEVAKTRFTLLMNTRLAAPLPWSKARSSARCGQLPTSTLAMQGSCLVPRTPPCAGLQAMATRLGSLPSNATAKNTAQSLRSGNP
eukprot:m.311284 g.311284  ORF g.311284 m.311284 type:complete len:596 (+) comp19652_c0_seq4:61-1848(+)